MDLDFQKHIPSNFSDSSRVWVYQSNRRFSITEALEMETDIENFVGQWNTHGTANKSFVNLFFGQFLVIMADESLQTVSGCSTDSSVRFIKVLEKKFSVNFFDRQSLGFIIKDQLQILPLIQIEYAVKNDFINGQTLYFNNIVSTKKELLESWIIPVKKSWLASRLGILIE